MSYEQAVIISILGVLFVLFVWGKWRYDVVSLMALLVAALFGIVKPESLFSGFGQLVSRLDGNADALLARFDLPADIETRSDAYVPFANTAMLLEHCADTLDCPDFGLRLSQQQGLSILGPIAVLARNTRTIEESVRSIGDYLHLISPAMTVRFELVPSQNCLRAIFKVSETGLFQTRQMYELYVGNGQLIVQMLMGSEVFAQRMYFPHSRLADDRVYRSLLRCDLVFDHSICAVDLPMSILRQQVMGADLETQRIASSYLSERYGGHAGQLNEQVIHLIGRLLPTGYCKIETIAQQLGMHPRTLQRRLAEQGEVFEKLVDQQRQSLVKRYLAESNLQLSQVAGLLGYNDQSALNRACRRWFDQTPRKIRLAHHKNSGQP